MADRIAYIFLRESDSPDPVMLIVLEDNQLRFMAPDRGPYSEVASRLNNGAIRLEDDELDEAFDDMVDRYDGTATMAQIANLEGADARRYAALTRKWRTRR